MDIKKYIKDHGCKKHIFNVDNSLEYEHEHIIDNYFTNVPPLEYDRFMITIDYSSASSQDFENYETMKKHFSGKGHHLEEHTNYSYEWIFIMTATDYDAMDLYNHWKDASVKTFEDLQHKHYSWTLKHDNQFNNHIKKIMDYYGNLYAMDKADLLTDKLYSMVDRDFSPDTEDYLPF